MKQVTVLLIGLGRMGSRFFDKFVEIGEKRVKIVGVCELNEQNPKVLEAKKRNIPLYPSYKEALTDLHESVDIILDTSNISEVKRDIRELLSRQNNQHSVLLPMVADYLLWYMLPNAEEIPQDHTDIGY